VRSAGFYGSIVPLPCGTHPSDQARHRCECEMMTPKLSSAHLPHHVCTCRHVAGNSTRSAFGCSPSTSRHHLALFPYRCFIRRRRMSSHVGFLPRISCSSWQIARATLSMFSRLSARVRPSYVHAHVRASYHPSRGRSHAMVTSRTRTRTPIHSSPRWCKTIISMRDV